MRSPEQEFAARLREHLDRSAGELRPGLAYRLQSARAEALARLAESPATAQVGGLAGAHGLAGGGASLGTPARPHRSLVGQARFWIGILAIAAAAFGYHQWTIWLRARSTRNRRRDRGGAPPNREGHECYIPRPDFFAPLSRDCSADAGVRVVKKDSPPPAYSSRWLT